MIANPTRAGGSGNVAFFEQLYSAHHRAILAYCARRCSLWDAWDAAAEVFVVAWRRVVDVPPAEEARAAENGRVTFQYLINRGPFQRQVQ
jgi:hypothetical protein